MAQRYGGKYSPDGAGDPVALGDTSPPTGKTNSFRSAQVDPVGARANTMFVPGGVLLILSLNDGATGLALGGRTQSWRQVTPSSSFPPSTEDDLRRPG